MCFLAVCPFPQLARLALTGYPRPSYRILQTLEERLKDLKIALGALSEIRDSGFYKLVRVGYSIAPNVHRVHISLKNNYQQSYQ